jgi:uncharacterized membrane protein YgcG
MHRIWFCLFVVFLLCPSSSHGRSLYWQDITVQANLDSAGRLHIREQQTIVFSGKWNGGERKFFLRPGNKMQFGSLLRLGADGQEIKLTRGSLGLVDRWNHNGKASIRWRSRLPSDPPFSNTPISYVLRYSIGNILTKSDNRYLLNHDFCFTERTGVVKNFSLILNYDPSWNSEPVTIVRHDIPPGEGVVYKQTLSFSGLTAPAVYSAPNGFSDFPKRSAVTSAPLGLRITVLVLLFIFIVWRGILFFRWEKRLERFVQLPDNKEVTPGWLEQEIFCYKPEVVGATWDKTTSTPEVAAVLARLVQEGKMKSTLTPYRLRTSYRIPFLNIVLPSVPPELHLELLVDRESLHGYERELVEEMFMDESPTTNTKKIREYYQRSRKTFNPVKKLADPLKKQMRKLTADGVGSPGHSWVPTVLLAVVGFFVLSVNAFYYQDECIALQLGGMLFILFCWAIAVVSAFNYRRSVVYLGWFFAMLFVAVFLLPAGFTVLFFFPVPSLLLIAFFCMAVAAANNAINLARSAESREGVAFRRKLAAARNYFITELQREKPDVRDEWFPYLLAFGLGPNVDHWFRHFGTGSASVHSRAGIIGNSASVGSGGFTGGGGAFGGGGSSGSWSSAAGLFASNSSSSSAGGGSGGGGGSSGGGGGGGW